MQLMLQVNLLGIFADFFHAIGFEFFDVYNPDRDKEGYGLTERALAAVLEKEPNLIITVDTGVTSYDEIADLEVRGVNVIVIDHHLVPPKWPPAYAILDPRQEDETYPFTGLSGTGLAFKTVSAILKKNSFGLVEGWEKWLLDLVAIAAVADMVPLVGENRTLVYWGLEVMRKSRRVGLRAMAQTMGLNVERITTDDIGFMVAPRINVAGGMEHATLAGQLLATNSREEAEWLAGRLEEKNNERKALVGEIVDQMKLKFASNLPAVIIAGDVEWRPGVLSIAANRMLETFGRPVILWGQGDGDFIKGSVRSDGTINVVEWMRKAGEDLFADFGGHPMAGGFSIEPAHRDIFEKRLEAAYDLLPKGENLYQELKLEKELMLDDVNERTFAEVSKFEPFGQENPKPAFWFRALIIEGVRTFGNGGIHLEFSFKNSSGNTMRSIGFWTSNLLDPVKAGDRVDLAASLERNTFRGYDELRLRIVDFKKI
jgi:single-stranded-DNA-specific exonuclease